MRIYLTGRLAVEVSGRLLDESELPSRQGRLAFAYLVLERRRLVPRTELAEAIWGEEPPEGWETGLSALLSRLRRMFRSLAVDAGIETLSGSVNLRLPSKTWVDLDDARNAIDEAAGALRAGDAARAWSNAAVAFSITERGFLSGEDLPWILRERERLLMDHVRVLEYLADIGLAWGDPAAALGYARRCRELQPFRESAYEREMRSQIVLGNRAEALRLYERLRALLADELGTDPSPALQATYLDALG